MTEPPVPPPSNPPTPPPPGPGRSGPPTSGPAPAVPGSAVPPPGVPPPLGPPPRRNLRLLFLLIGLALVVPALIAGGILFAVLSQPDPDVKPLAVAEKFLNNVLTKHDPDAAVEYVCASQRDVAKERILDLLNPRGGRFLEGSYWDMQEISNVNQRAHVLVKVNTKVAYLSGTFHDIDNGWLLQMRIEDDEWRICKW